MVGHKPFAWPGVVALVLTPGIAVFAVVYLLLVFSGDETSLEFDAYTLSVLEFTFLQSALSTVLSVLFAVPVTRALARRKNFPGRQVIVNLFGLPLVIPVLVSIFGILAVWGHHGIISHALEQFGLEPLKPVYGLAGILITHVFFNMPLVVRLLLPVWDMIPGESWRIAGMTGMPPGAIFRYIELPKIRESLPGIAILVFLLCFTSFTTVLIMGGGPKATTLEVAIFHEIRSNFNVSKAVVFALIQVLICLVVSLLLLRFSLLPEGSATESRTIFRPDCQSLFSRLNDGAWIGIGCLWISGPILATLVRGFDGPMVSVLTNERVWLASGRSLLVGVGSGVIAITVGTLLCMTSRDLAVRMRRVSLANRMELIGSQSLIVSPVVFGTGLFVILSPWISVFDYSLFLATLINGLIAVPFVVRLISPVLRQTALHHDKLCATLGLVGWNRIRTVEIPTTRKTMATAFALTAAMATGDLTSVIFFSSGREPTLSLLLYQALGNYRADESAVMSLLLIALCLGVYVIIERLGRVLFRS